MFAMESDGSRATEDALPAVACVIPAPTARTSTKDRADNLRLVAVACLFFQATVVGLFALLQHADGAVSLPEAFLLQLWLFAIACVVTVLDVVSWARFASLAIMLVHEVLFRAVLPCAPTNHLMGESLRCGGAMDHSRAVNALFHACSLLLVVGIWEMAERWLGGVRHNYRRRRRDFLQNALARPPWWWPAALRNRARRRDERRLRMLGRNGRNGGGGSGSGGGDGGSGGGSNGSSGSSGSGAAAQASQQQWDDDWEHAGRSYHTRQLVRAATTQATVLCCAGPLVLFTSGQIFGASATVREALVDFCSRDARAAWVGPFAWAWDGCALGANATLLTELRPPFGPAVSDLTQLVRARAARAYFAAHAMGKVYFLQGCELLFLFIALSMARHAANLSWADVKRFRLTRAEGIAAVVHASRLPVERSPNAPDNI